MAIGGLCILLFCFSGCYTFSTMQRAKLLQKGDFEITPYLSTVYYNSGSTDRMTYQYGLQSAYGLNDRLNFRVCYELIDIENSQDPWHFLSIAPKVPIMGDWLSFSFPVGTVFGSGVETSDSWQVHPTLMATIIPLEWMELNLSAKGLVFAEKDYDNLVALNSGFGLSTNLDRWAVRPEFGVLFNPKEQFYFFSWNLGFTFYP
ncbi:hypothetical protein JW877_04325 [bacterium]|nr:hypothetical protein [bacterium]